MTSKQHLSKSLVKHGKAALFPFLFNSAIGNVLQKALSGFADGGVGLLPESEDFYFGYTDNFALLNNNAQAIQHAVACLVVEVSGCDKRLVLSEFELLHKGWQETVLAITLCGDHLDVISCFKYLCRLTTDGSGEIKRRSATA